MTTATNTVFAGSLVTLLSPFAPLARRLHRSDIEHACPDLFWLIIATYLEGNSRNDGGRKRRGAQTIYEDVCAGETSGADRATTRAFTSAASRRRRAGAGQRHRRA